MFNDYRIVPPFLMKILRQKLTTSAMPVKVVIDTNILISAVIESSAAVVEFPHF
jgi:hypothetical protein